jgi:hypothetical protein
LYTKPDKTLKNIEELNKQRNILCSWIGILNSLKTAGFRKLDKLTLKFIWKCKGFEIAQMKEIKNKMDSHF